MDRADRYARLVILGQTMSGSQDASKGGGKAFGAVESDVKARRIESAARYVAGVVNGQLIPSILMLNYGDSSEAPVMRMLDDEEVGLEEAQRDKTLADAGLAIPAAFLRKKYGLPEPRDGEEVIGGRADDETYGRRKLEDGRAGKKAERLEEDGDDLEARDLMRLLDADDAVFARELGEMVCGNDNHDKVGRFAFAADKGGTTGSGRSGDQALIKESDYRTSPRPIPSHEAVRKLEEGFAHTGKDGRSFRFGKSLLDKFASKPDGDFRLRHLPHAMDTLSYPFHVEYQASQDMHIGLHVHEGKPLHTYVFTGMDGEVTDVMGYYFPRKTQVLRELGKFKRRAK